MSQDSSKPTHVLVYVVAGLITVVPLTIFFGWQGFWSGIILLLPVLIGTWFFADLWHTITYDKIRPAGKLKATGVIALLILMTVGILLAIITLTFIGFLLVTAPSYISFKSSLVMYALMALPILAFRNIWYAKTFKDAFNRISTFGAQEIDRAVRIRGALIWLCVICI